MTSPGKSASLRGATTWLISLELDWPSQKTFWTKASNADLRNVLRKILSYLKMPVLIETDKYIEQLIKANNTFLYRLVFDLLTRKERLVIMRKN